MNGWLNETNSWQTNLANNQSNIKQPTNEPRTVKKEKKNGKEKYYPISLSQQREGEVEGRKGHFKQVLCVGK